MWNVFRFPSGLPLFSALLSYLNQRWCLTVPCSLRGGSEDCRLSRNVVGAMHTGLSMLVCANRAGMNISRVIVPGLCTGYGKMNRKEAVCQLAQAFNLVFIEDKMVCDASQMQHPRLFLNQQIYEKKE